MPLKVETTRSHSSASSSACTCALLRGGVFDAAIVSEHAGVVVIRVSGNGADELFANEAGGHRWQRIPPNERRGRVHTSTVTVAVLPEPTEAQVQIRESDVEWQACRGSGAGGQNRNKVNSAVQLWHRPTGIAVRCESERSQWQNRQTAMAMLRARLWQARSEASASTEAAARKEQ